MRFDKSTGKTIALACVILFAGILFSTWVLPAITEERNEPATVMPVTLNNPQKIIESPTIKADPQKMYPATYGLREPLNTSQIDETVSQARNLFLTNVSEAVEYLFNLNIDSVIMEKYAEVWELVPGRVTVPTEPVWEPVDSQASGDSSAQDSGESSAASSEPETGDPQSSGSQDPEADMQSSSSEATDYEQQLEEQRRQEEYEKQQEEYQRQQREYERYLYEETRGNAFSLDILFTDAKSTTWRITAYGYADEVTALHCVKEDIEVTPVSIFQEEGLGPVDFPTVKMDSAASLFLSRIESVKYVNDIYDYGYFEYIEAYAEAPSSEFYWQIYGWTSDGDRALIAGFRADSNTPVCYGLVPLEDNLSDVLSDYGYEPSYFYEQSGYDY